MYPDAEAYRAELIRIETSLGAQPDPDMILACLRRHKVFTKAWNAVLRVCRRTAPDAPWQDLPVPDFEADIGSATEWLDAQLRRMPKATGIYLGLDTLNMRDGAGTNVEIGGTSNCDPSQDTQEWTAQDLKYGDRHLIKSLVSMSAAYASPTWRRGDHDYFDFADYVLFLALSGIVLGQALQRLNPGRALLSVWGFHDGDTFLLGRNMPVGFTALYQ
jgi:hypothetical protein